MCIMHVDGALLILGKKYDKNRAMLCRRHQTRGCKTREWGVHCCTASIASMIQLGRKPSLGEKPLPNIDPVQLKLVAV